MIHRITGKILAVDQDTLILGVDAFEYLLLIPEFVRRHLQGKIGQTVSLHTIQYLDGNPAHGRLVPRLVGFSNPIEREFFELFCSVDGVGVKKALRAMVRPVPEVAALIEEQNTDALASLPGIGPATAERIVAKLRRKVPKFALLVVSGEGAGSDVKPNVIEETYQVLRTLGHSEVEARKLLDAALASKKAFPDVESLIQAIYQLSHRR